MSDGFDPRAVTEFDARALLARGMQPLPVILELADALEPGRVLHVRTPFLPHPLHGVLAARGFAHRTTQFADDDFSTWFWRTDHPPPEANDPAPGRPAAPPDVTDLRWLAPPEPLLWILRWTAEHPDGTLRVMLPFFPQPLPELLANDGWSVQTEEDRGDGVVVKIERLKD